MGFPGGSEVKASVCNEGDLGSIPRLGRSPGEGNANPLQYSCLENPMDEEPGGLLSTGSKRVWHNWATSLSFSQQTVIMLLITHDCIYLALLTCVMKCYWTWKKWKMSLGYPSYILLLLLSHFSRVWLCATPEMAAHQAPPSLGFSRQQHWSGLPFPSSMHESEKSKWIRSVMSNPQRPHGLQPTRLLHPRDFPGKSTGVGCHCLLHLIF